MRLGKTIALVVPALLAVSTTLWGQVQTDERIGVLRVGAEEAVIVDGRSRVRLIQVPPQTAVDVDPLLAQTAEVLAPLDGKRVRATGTLQEGILWSVLVEELEEDEPEQQVIDVEEELPAEGEPAGEEAAGEEAAPAPTSETTEVRPGEYDPQPER